MTPPLVYAGITRETAPIDVRERFQCDVTGRRSLAALLQREMNEIYILQTCERFEVYGVAAVVHDTALRRALATFFRVPIGLVERTLRVQRGTAVARHWLEVAAGLSSRLPGEPHVLGQVKRAYVEALDAGWLGPILASLGRTAIRAGKRVRTVMASCTPPPPAGLAVERLRADLGSLRHRRIGLLGTGAIAREVRSLLHQAGGSIVIASRDPNRARSLRGLPGVDRAVGLDELPRLLAGCDGLVTCSHAGRPLLDAAHLACRRGRTLSIIDLGVPRNVAIDVTTHADVLLTHLEGLHASAALAPHICSAASQILDDELARFTTWYAHRRARHEIARLVRDAPQDTLAQRRRLDRLIRSLKAQVAA